MNAISRGPTRREEPAGLTMEGPSPFVRRMGQRRRHRSTRMVYSMHAEWHTRQQLQWYTR